MKGQFNENKELLRSAGENWKKLTDTDKKPYEGKAEQERKRYEVAMRDYHQQGGGGPKAKKPKVEEANNGNDDDDDDEEEDDDDDDDDDDDEDDD